MRGSMADACERSGSTWQARGQGFESPKLHTVPAAHAARPTEDAEAALSIVRRSGRPARVASNALRIVILVSFAIFFALPLVWLVLATTKSGDQLQTGAPLGWGSIEQLISNWHRLKGFLGDAYLGWVGNTAKYTLSALAIVLVVDIPAGYGLAIASGRWQRPVLMVTLVVMLMPSFALVLPIFLEINDAHLIGNALSLILPFAFFPFGVYLAYLYFSTHKTRDLLSAARVDGCSELQVFLRIALPLSKPVVALVAFFSFMANWNNYFLPLAMLPSSKSYPLQLGLVLLPRGSPVLALGTLIAALPVLLVFLFSQRYLVAGLTAGSTTD
jgi:multiple sugar transport system permease protein